jgi:hypothetical protein
LLPGKSREAGIAVREAGIPISLRSPYSNAAVGASAASEYAPGFRELPARSAVFTTCANPDCASGWLKLFRPRSAPCFEGEWCCSAACVKAVIASAMRREMDARASGTETHSHRIPLGLAMLEQGWITGAQLRGALEAQHSAGAGRLGYWLVHAEGVSEQLVTRALGLQWSCPVLNTEFHDVDGLALLVPRLFVDAFGALPLRTAASRILYMGFEDRLDSVLAFAVERMTGLRVECGVVATSVFRPAHSAMLAAAFPAVELIEASSETNLVQLLARIVEQARPFDSRLVRVHDCFWLRMWLRPQTGAVPDRNGVRDVIATSRTH